MYAYGELCCFYVCICYVNIVWFVNYVWQNNSIYAANVYIYFKYNEYVTGEGQKTSSVLIRALSRVKLRFRLEQVWLVQPKLRKKVQVLLPVETKETQLES